jgi:hypothetical protein
VNIVIVRFDSNDGDNAKVRVKTANAWLTDHRETFKEMSE